MTRPIPLLILSVLFSGLAVSQPTIQTVAGDGPSIGVGGQLSSPYDVVEDSTKAIYVAEAGRNRVLKLANGILSVAANTSQVASFSGDGGPATAAGLNGPQGLAFDSQGDLFIADTGNERIREIIPNGNIITVAGNGTAGFSGDGGPATNASLDYPAGIAVNSAGYIFFADDLNQRIRMISPQGVISTVAGDGAAGYTGDGISATSAALNFPEGVALDAAGNLYIADNYNCRIRKVSVNGLITTVVGNGTPGYNGDGIPASSAAIDGPTRVGFDHNGNLLVVDSGNQRIRRVDKNTGIISTIAGTGTMGYSGDGGPATAGDLNIPHSIFPDSDGNLLFADYGSGAVRAIGPDGILSTLIGLVGGDGWNPLSAPIGDGDPATSVELYSPMGVAADSNGNLYFADVGHLRVRRVDSVTGIITTVVGGGPPTRCPDGSKVTTCSVLPYNGLAVDRNSDLFFSDSTTGYAYPYAGVVRRVDGATGVITTVASPAPSVWGYGSTGLAVGDGGDVFFGAGNGNIYKIDAQTGAVGTVLSLPLPAVPADLFAYFPNGIAVDGAGNIFFTVTWFSETVFSPNAWLAVFRIDGVTGQLTTIAGNGQTGFSGDGGPASKATLAQPGGLATDAAGNLYICDGNRIRRIDAATQIVTTVAGDGSAVFSGDGGPATSAGGFLCLGGGVAIASDGTLFLSNGTDNRVRAINLPPPPEGTRPAFVPAAVVNAASPQALAGVASGAFFTIYGSNLSPNSSAGGTTWSALFQGSSAPTSIDGVRVLVNGVPAFLNFVSNSQINAVAPDGIGSGTAVVRVVNSNGISDPVIVQVMPVSPALFTTSTNGVTYAVTSSDSYRPGDVVTLWGNGFGPTTPPVPEGQIPSSPAVLGNVTVTIGGAPATMQFAGLTSLGLYQFNVVVPNVPAGNQPVVLQIRGASTPGGVFLNIE